MFHILGIIIAVYVGIVLLSWFQAARPDHPAAQGRRIGVVTWADLVAMLVRRIWRISVFCAAWVLRPRPRKPAKRGDSDDFRNKGGPKPSRGKIGSDSTLRFSKNAELAR